MSFGKNSLNFQAREMLLPTMGDGLPLHAGAAMIAGFVTTIASLPVDIVKTRYYINKDLTKMISRTKAKSKNFIYNRLF